MLDEFIVLPAFSVAPLKPVFRILHQHEKKFGKTWFLQFCDLLITCLNLKIGLNVPLSKNRRKKIVSILKTIKVKGRIRIWICNPVARIRTLAKRNGSGTHGQKFLIVVRFELRYEERRHKLRIRFRVDLQNIFLCQNGSDLILKKTLFRQNLFRAQCYKQIWRVGKVL